MSLKQKVNEDLKAAMKAGETVKKDTLRMLDAMIKNQEIEKRKKEEGLNDEEVVAVIKKAVKQRKDSIEQYLSGGRPELAEKEKAEVDILSVYLPSMMDESAVEVLVKEVIQEANASSKAELGKIMGLAMKKAAGQADGNLIRQMAERLLN
jgi:uncharacterized protein YqeY